MNEDWTHWTQTFGQEDKLAALLSDCRKDEGIKQRFLAKPRATLEHYGIKIPAVWNNAEIVLREEHCAYITLYMPKETRRSNADLISLAEWYVRRRPIYSKDYSWGVYPDYLEPGYPPRHGFIQNHVSEHFAHLLAACWKYETLKRRFISNPESVLMQFDLQSPACKEVKVHERSEEISYLLMPKPF